MTSVCILFGSTGVGKSSFIQPMTNNNVFIAHTGDSGTKKPEFHKSNFDNKLEFLDTRGFQDSNLNITDDQTYSTLLKQLYVKKVKNIHIIWIIKSDTIRCNSQLQTEAKFINCLGSGIWKSVAVVIKKSTSLKGVKDPILKAINESCNKSITDVRCYSLLNLDAIERNDPDDDLLDIALNKKKVQEKKTMGIYYIRQKETPSFYKTIVEGISSCSLNFKTNEKCVNCGQTGDQRFFTPKCHSNFVKKHLVNKPTHYEDFGFSTNAKVLGGLAVTGGILATGGAAGLALAGIAVEGGGVVVGGTLTTCGEWVLGGTFLSNIALAITGVGGGVVGTAGGVSFMDRGKHWKCCGRSKRNDRGCRWSCCQKGDSHAGCTSICSNCDNQKGTSGCVNISRDLKHQIISI